MKKLESNTKEFINEEKQSIIDKWKELNLDRVEFEFSCEGDQMNETTTILFNKENSKIGNSEISKYFEEEIYRNVKFYVNSDGAYLGEFGTVYITLEEEEFLYSKVSKSEYNEIKVKEILVKLTKKEQELINKYISNINGNANGFQINYNKECVISDRDYLIINKLGEKIQNTCIKFEDDICIDYEINDDIRFNTNNEEDVKNIKIVDQHLQVLMYYSYYKIIEE